MPKDAIEDHLQELLPHLRRFAIWLTRDAASADDLVQSTLERALSRRHTRNAEALRPWLFAIEYRQFLDDRRRSRRYAKMLEFFRGRDEPATPSVEREVIARSVVQALECLPEAQRHLLLWVSVEGLSYREAADILNVPIGTVMSRLSRARVALHRSIDGETPDISILRSSK